MGIKLYVYIIIATLLAAALGGAVWYYKWSQAEIKVLRENNTKLVIAVDTQKKTIEAQIKDAKLKNDLVTATSIEYEKARAENIALRQKLAKHDIAYLASKRPKTIKRIITKASDNAERCFEILSGSPLTEKEKAATKKSQANNECPGLANPNYVVKP